jgi:hypothetical protein
VQFAMLQNDEANVYLWALVLSLLLHLDIYQDLLNQWYFEPQQRLEGLKVLD